jgi:hypothetical protein
MAPTVMTAPITITMKLSDCWVARAAFSFPESSLHRNLPSSLVTVICFLDEPVLEGEDLPRLLWVA